jgi:GTPase SAR1 family protein
MKLNWLKNLLSNSEEKQELYIRVEAADKGKIELIKSVLAQAETEQAIEILETLEISAIENDVIALSSRYQSLQSSQLHGLLSSNDYSLQTNRINHDILILVARLEKSLEPEKIIWDIKINLRKRYQKRLEDKLADRQPINIQCAYSIEGTALERAQIAYDEVVLEQKQVQSNLENLFDRHRGRLLIIGDPGAGKTSMLLQLADVLLQRRENRVPVILNLSTWMHTHITLNQWLFETVPTAAGVSKAMAKSLVLENRLLPFFDGLDEVAAEHRNSCLEAIAQYGSEADQQYVICSRTAEYSETAGAPVYGQIKLLPLTQEQIVLQLEKSDQPEAKFLLHALSHQPVLAKVVETPFYFNTMQLLLSSMKSMADLHIQADNEEEMKAELVEKFVEQQLDTPVNLDFPVGKSRRWLGFLAKKMDENRLVVFELADLKLAWLRDKWAYFMLNIAVFTFGIFFPFSDTENDPIKEFNEGFNEGINNGIKFSVPVNELINSINYNWLGVLLLSTFWIIFASGRFNAYDRITWNLNRFKNNFKIASIKFVIGSIMFYTYIFIIIKYNLKEYIQYNIFLSNLRILLILIFLVIAIGRNIYLIALWFLLVCFTRILNDGLFSKYVLIPFIIPLALRVIKSGIETKTLPNINTPYNRFVFSGLVDVIVFLSLIFYIIFDLRGNLLSLSFKDFSDLISFVCFLVPFSLIFRHFIVRLVCVIKLDLPLRLATFLNEMTARHLFESDGGSWRFRHRILQDYFVQKYSSNGNKIDKSITR